MKLKIVSDCNFIEKGNPWIYKIFPKSLFMEYLWTAASEIVGYWSWFDEDFGLYKRTMQLIQGKCIFI